MFTERIDGPTPSGGTHTLVHYAAASKEDVRPGTELAFVEYDENGEMILEGWGTAFLERRP